MSDHASRDNNMVTTLLAVSNADGISPVLLWADPSSHRLLVQVSGVGTNWSSAETPSGTINGSNATFTLANTPTDNPIIVVSGQTQNNGYPIGTGADFTISSTTITFQSGSIPAIGSWILAWYHY